MAGGGAIGAGGMAGGVHSVIRRPSLSPSPARWAGARPALYASPRIANNRFCDAAQVSEGLSPRERSALGAQLDRRQGAGRAAKRAHFKVRERGPQVRNAGDGQIGAERIDTCVGRQLDSALRRRGAGLSLPEVDVMKSTTLLTRRLVAPIGADGSGRFVPTS
jgi:hypothetical protein